MERKEFSGISSERKIIFKRPKIYSQINIKEIESRNDPRNYLHSISKSNSSELRLLIRRKVKKRDIKGQIDLLSDLINNYSSSSIKNLYLIQKLKDENDFLIEELKKNINKNTLFSKTTKETFHDLVSQYEKKGYKIPNLTLEKNLFKKSPLLIETLKDVDDFYKNDKNTQGKFIEDLNNFPEKNWNFLKKLKRNVEIVKEKNLKNDMEGTKVNSKGFYKEIDFYSKQKALTERNERENLIKEIDRIKELVENQEKEKDDISDLNFLYNQQRKDSICRTSKNLGYSIKELLQKRLAKKEKNNNGNNNSSSMKKLSVEIKNKELFKKKIYKNSFNKSYKGFYRNKKSSRIDGRNIKTYITSLNEKPKKKLINVNNKSNILSYTEQVYQKVNKKKLTDFHLIENEITQYLKKKNYNINTTNLNNFNKDCSKRIYDVKNKINRHGLINIVQEHISSYDNNGYNKLKKVKHVEKILNKMDKYFANHIINKYFDD